MTFRAIIERLSLPFSFWWGMVVKRIGKQVLLFIIVPLEPKGIVFYLTSRNMQLLSGRSLITVIGYIHINVCFWFLSYTYPVCVSGLNVYSLAYHLQSLSYWTPLLVITRISINTTMRYAKACHYHPFYFDFFWLIRSGKKTVYKFYIHFEINICYKYTNSNCRPYNFSHKMGELSTCMWLHYSLLLK